MWELEDALDVEVGLELELAFEVEMQLKPELATTVSPVALPPMHSLVDPDALALENVQLRAGCWEGSSGGQWLQGILSEARDPVWILLEGLERCFH